jgi:hypothetical protein
MKKGMRNNPTQRHGATEERIKFPSVSLRLRVRFFLIFLFPLRLRLSAALREGFFNILRGEL